jgi:hypothetical protein
MFTSEIVSVKQFTYRTAMVVGGMEIPRTVMASVESMLAHKAGVSKDNHTVYQVQYGCGSTQFFGFSDLSCYVGNGIRIERY